MNLSPTLYPTDVSDEEWALIAPYVALLPRRWVVECSFAWATRFRRLDKDDEGYASTLAGLHLVAFACLMLRKTALLATGS